jgi:hypothetical protein
VIREEDGTKEPASKYLVLVTEGEQRSLTFALRVWAEKSRPSKGESGEVSSE